MSKILNHKHGKDCHHDHDKSSKTKLSRAFYLGISLNLIFTIIEFSYGIISNSVALVADAGHNLSDVLGLIVALIASLLLKKQANKKFTYGLRGGTILSALMNSSLLFITVGAILWESIQRLHSTSVIQTNTMIIVATIGIIINLVTAMFFHSHSHDDLNAKGAYLHLMGDAAISLGVVIAGLAIKFTGFSIIDPIISILISIVIIFSTWNLFKESLYQMLNAVPEKIDIDAIHQYLSSRSGVIELHDLHVWAMSTTENAMTVHLVIPEPIADNFLLDIEHNLKDKFKIHHSTIQIEKSNNHRHQAINCY